MIDTATAANWLTRRLYKVAIYSGDIIFGRTTEQHISRVNTASLPRASELQTTIVRSTSISTMVPVFPNHCQHLPAEFRIMPGPIPLPPNHVFLHCLCPCGAHRIHFAVHRNVLFDQMARNQLVMQNVQPLPLIQRLAEMQLYRRSRRHYRAHHSVPKMDSDEEDIDR